MNKDSQLRKSYPTDLTDEQWELLQPLLRRKPGPGRPTEVDLREIINAIVYIDRTGCQWRMLPHDLPSPSNVRYYYDKWTETGTLAEINRHLGQQVRIENGRDPEPTLAIVDSQSVRTTEEARGEKGIDGNKKIKGRKRQLMVDIMGNLLGIVVHAANVNDVIGGSGAVAYLSRIPVQADQGPGRPRLRGGVDEIGGGRVWGGSRSGAQGARAEGLCRAAETVGGRTHDRLDKSISAISQGLRTIR